MVPGQDLSAPRKRHESFECRGVQRSFPWPGGRIVVRSLSSISPTTSSDSDSVSAGGYPCSLERQAPSEVHPLLLHACVPSLSVFRTTSLVSGSWVRFEAVFGSINPMFPPWTCYNASLRERSASIFFTSTSSLKSPMGSPVLQTMASNQSRSAKIAVIDGYKLKRTVDVGHSNPLSGPNCHGRALGEGTHWAITSKCCPQDIYPQHLCHRRGRSGC